MLGRDWLMPAQETALRSVVDVLRRTGEHPVVWQLRVLLLRRGIPDHREVLAEFPSWALVIDEPLTRLSRARITVEGFASVDPEAPELQWCMEAMRSAGTRILYEAPESLSHAGSLMVTVRDLLLPQAGRTETGERIVALLLEVEGVAELREYGRRPWTTLELKDDLLELRHVGDLPRYLERRRELDV